MRVSYNHSAITLIYNLQKHNQSAMISMEKLSSGSSVNKAADHAASLSISEKMRAQIRGLVQAQRNIQDGTSLIQTAEGGLSQISNYLHRARELSVQAANDTLTDRDRSILNNEMKEILAGIDDISNNTEFNNIHLLNRENRITTENKIVTEDVTVAAGTIWDPKESGTTKNLNQIYWSGNQYVAAPTATNSSPFQKTCSIFSSVPEFCFVQTF